MGKDTGKDTEKEREKIESKGAYSFDLHEAIRDVRSALGSGSRALVVETKLDSLFDILAPEIREAVKERWDGREEEWDEVNNRLDSLSYVDSYSSPNYWEISVEGYAEGPWYFDKERKAEAKAREFGGRVPGGGENDEGYVVKKEKVYRVSTDADRFFFDTKEEAENRYEEIKSNLEGKLPDDDFERLRVLFRIVVDVLDAHGELRKWRDVEYGKV